MRTDVKGVATCGRCGFQWVRGPDEARWARTCTDCVDVCPPRPRLVEPSMPLRDPRQPLVTYLGVRVADLSAAVRTALAALWESKPAEAQRVLQRVMQDVT